MPQNLTRIYLNDIPYPGNVYHATDGGSKLVVRYDYTMAAQGAPFVDVTSVYLGNPDDGWLWVFLGPELPLAIPAVSQ